MKIHWIIILLIVLLLLMVIVPSLWAAPSATYTLQKKGISSGGGRAASASGDVTMASTMGQASVGETTSANFTLIPGFWTRMITWMETVLLPLIIKE
jgi:hypothetical protein